MHPLKPSPAATPAARLGVVVAGHVDHGKSTVVGRLLADAGGLPQGRLAQVRADCERHGRPFEYAFLLDALKDERAQGITIDSARVFFRSPAREYVVIDAPGHVEFLRNLVSGASRADAALLVVDARAGVEDNTRRHAALLALLGVTHVAVLVNKMDQVGRAEAAFRQRAHEVRDVLQGVGLSARAVVPVCGRDGDNLATRAAAMGWYDGPTVLEALDGFPAPVAPRAAPLRLWVQDVYRFGPDATARRIVAGTVDAGALAAGDELLFLPSGKRARVATLEAFPGPAPTHVEAGHAAGFTLAPQVYVQRGELAVRDGDAPPRVSTRVRATVLWLGTQALAPGRAVTLKVGTARTGARVERVHRVVDAAAQQVESRQEVRRNELAECTLRLERALPFDTGGDFPDGARFVLVEDFDVRGGGVVREVLDDAHDAAREAVWRRNRKWEATAVPADVRARRHGQRPAALVITGPAPHPRKDLARALEARLFADGHAPYFLGIGNVLHGVDQDLPREPAHRLEHLRRLAEVAHLLLDAGHLLLVTAQELTAAEVALLRAHVAPWPVEVAWLGDAVTTDLTPDVTVSPSTPLDAAAAQLQGRLPLSAREEGQGEGKSPFVLWLTGLPGAGKTTLARAVTEALRARGLSVEHLDGDAIRDVFPATGFTRDEREAHVRRVGYLASRLEAHGVCVVASLVSPYEASRRFVRAQCTRFVEVHVATPLAECERRDPKGLYVKARAGALPHFTGVSDPYEAPTAPELTLDTTGRSVDDAVAAVLAVLDRA